jgi:hypothetical protein
MGETMPVYLGLVWRLFLWLLGLFLKPKHPKNQVEILKKELHDLETKNSAELDKTHPNARVLIDLANRAAELRRTIDSLRQ